MSEQKFYYIKDFTTSLENEKYSYNVGFNSKHPIFSGHFPGNPILPGVCILQMIKDIVSRIMNTDFWLVKSSNIKYLNLINPTEHASVQLEIKIKTEAEGKIKVNCVVSDKDINFCNFNGEFQLID